MLGVINRRIGAATIYHDVLHSLQADRGTGTAPLEANLLQFMREMRDDFLYEIFLYLMKSYDAINR